MVVHVVWPCVMVVLQGDAHGWPCGQNWRLGLAVVAQAVRTRPQPSAGQLVRTFGPSLPPVISAAFFTFLRLSGRLCGGVSGGSLLVR